MGSMGFLLNKVPPCQLRGESVGCCILETGGSGEGGGEKQGQGTVLISKPWDYRLLPPHANITNQLLQPHPIITTRHFSLLNC